MGVGQLPIKLFIQSASSLLNAQSLSLLLKGVSGEDIPANFNVLTPSTLPPLMLITDSFAHAYTIVTTHLHLVVPLPHPFRSCKQSILVCLLVCGGHIWQQRGRRQALNC